MESRTDRIRTELGNLYLAVTFDENGRPFEVFGWIGKTGTFGHGMTELAWTLRISSGVSEGVHKSVEQGDREFLHIGVGDRQ